MSDKSEKSGVVSSREIHGSSSNEAVDWMGHVGREQWRVRRAGRLRRR